MPKLWDSTVASHKAALREAILDAVEAGLAKGGPASLSMSELAIDAGIGRATLYKYFSDVQSALEAWHSRQVERHLAQLVTVVTAGGSPADRLRQLLGKFADLSHRTGAHAWAEAMHAAPSTRSSEERVAEIFEAVITEGQRLGHFRNDISARDLAMFCLGAGLGAARTHSPSRGRLVEMSIATLAGNTDGARSTALDL